MNRTGEELDNEYITLCEAGIMFMAIQCTDENGLTGTFGYRTYRLKHGKPVFSALTPVFDNCGILFAYCKENNITLEMK